MKKTKLLLALVVLFAVGSAFVSITPAANSTVYFKDGSEFRVKHPEAGSCTPVQNEFCTYQFIGQGDNIPVSQESTDYQAVTSDPGRWVE